MNDLIIYNRTSDIYEDAASIIEQGQKAAYRAVDVTLVVRNWLLGKRIAEEVLCGSDRAAYGDNTIISLSKRLGINYGKGFDRVSLYRYLKFFQMFPEIVATVRQQSGLLSWSHYRILLQVNDETARKWYEKEAFDQDGSTRTLQRNVSSQYYYRMLKTQDPQGVEREMKEKTSPYQDKLEFIRNPVIAEFLDMQQKEASLSDIEASG